jgi:hypothetical protein
MVIKCLAWKRRKKNKKLKAKVKLDRSFLVWWSRHLVSVITFRIDSHTIKRGETQCLRKYANTHAQGETLGG